MTHATAPKRFSRHPHSTLRRARALLAAGLLVGSTLAPRGAEASGRIVGNGGLVVHCGVEPPPTPTPTASPSDPFPTSRSSRQDTPRENVREEGETYETLDLYEARVLRGWKIDVPKDADAMGIVRHVLERWRPRDPARAERYLKEAETFFDGRAALIPNLELPPTNDAGDVILQKKCVLEQVAVQVEPAFPGDVSIRISRDIWDRLDETSRAALILHEMIYAEFLDAGVKTSQGTRFWVGQLLSGRVGNYATDKAYYGALAASGLYAHVYKGVHFRYFPEADDSGRYNHWVKFDAAGAIATLHARETREWSQLAPGLAVQVEHANFDAATGTFRAAGNTRVAFGNATVSLFGDDVTSLVKDGGRAFELLAPTTLQPNTLVRCPRCVVEGVGLRLPHDDRGGAGEWLLRYDDAGTLGFLAWTNPDMSVRNADGTWRTLESGLMHWDATTSRWIPEGAPRKEWFLDCPEGSVREDVGNEGGHLCRSGPSAVGPFTRKMVEACEKAGGGSVCAEGRWRFEFARTLRGDGRCPAGSAWESAYEACRENDRAWPEPEDVVMGTLSPRALGYALALSSRYWKASARDTAQGRVPTVVFREMRALFENE